MVGVRISVADNGIGINEQDQKNLFKPYFRTTDSKSKKMNANSHGLGLSICHDIVGGLGGKLWCESALGNGSTFTFTFNAKRVKEDPTQQERIVSNERRP